MTDSWFRSAIWATTPERVNNKPWFKVGLGSPAVSTAGFTFFTSTKTAVYLYEFVPNTINTI
jgi:hypothetical protein